MSYSPARPSHRKLMHKPAPPLASLVVPLTASAPILEASAPITEMPTTPLLEASAPRMEVSHTPPTTPVAPSTPAAPVTPRMDTIVTPPATVPSPTNHENEKVVSAAAVLGPHAPTRPSNRRKTHKPLAIVSALVPPTPGPSPLNSPTGTETGTTAYASAARFRTSPKKLFQQHIYSRRLVGLDDAPRWQSYTEFFYCKYKHVYNI